MNGNISIVIGSWGSYNECNERALGSKWLDLSDYDDWEEIVEELKKEGFELRSICKQNHWQLVNVGRNHYCFSAFIKSAENKCVYVSISDVRYFSNEWYNHILIRTAKSETDYRGGFNNYTTLDNLELMAAELLEDLPF